MTNQTLAYLAGIVDGEGTISLHASNATRYGIYAAPFVQIATSSPKLASWLNAQSLPKGSHYHYDRHPDKWKPTWLFMWRSANAVAFIELVRPWLIIKAEQAELVLDFFKGGAAWNGNRRGKWCRSNPMPDDVKQKRIAVFGRVKELNRKGPKKE